MKCVSTTIISAVVLSVTVYRITDARVRFQYDDNDDDRGGPNAIDAKQTTDDPIFDQDDNDEGPTTIGPVTEPTVPETTTANGTDSSSTPHVNRGDITERAGVFTCRGRVMCDYYRRHSYYLTCAPDKSEQMCWVVIWRGYEVKPGSDGVECSSEMPPWNCWVRYKVYAGSVSDYY